MTLKLKECDDERKNIIITLYYHESDSQQLFYFKITLVIMYHLHPVSKIFSLISCWNVTIKKYPYLVSHTHPS